MVAATLAAHAAHLAQHWLERALAATPRRVVPVGAGVGEPSAGANTAAPALGATSSPDADAPLGPDPGHAELVVHALAASLRSAQAASLVIAGSADAGRPASTHGAHSPDARPTGEVMRLGWAAGRAAFAAGLSVHHVVRDADLLLAVVLADVERALADVPPAPGASAAEAFTVARRLQRAAGRYAQAAVSGFVHALLAELRERYRLLRHDLRNPLGTIRSALSLMEDESVPAETRHGPNIRAMVARNAGSLDTLIGRSLDDAAAMALISPAQEVGLRDVALAARREVRDAARLAGCEIVVDLPDAGPSRVDGAALELTLTAVLLAALSHAAPGAAIRIAHVEPPPPPATATVESGETAEVLQVTIEPPEYAEADRSERPAGTRSLWDEQGLRLAVELAYDHGARLGADMTVPRVRNVDDLLLALASAPTVYLRLPIDAAPDRQEPAPERR